MFDFLDDLAGLNGVDDDETSDTFVADTNGDGIFDTLTTVTYDMDGNVEASQFMSDTDGDGIFDAYGEAFSVDTDGDGIVDSLIFQQDNDLDGLFDISAIVNESGNISFIDETGAFQDELNGYNSLAIENASNLEQFDPKNYSPDDIIGDPDAAMQVFHPQETNSSCAVAAQEFVLDQLTGYDFTEAELREMAEVYGWYSPGEGTTAYNIGNVLAECGLTVHRDYGNTIDDIAKCLENGGGVVVAVDVYELYDIDVPGEGANHAIQVVGVDKSDPENPMVIINDSSMQNGGGLMIPIDSFMDAWEDSDFLMVEAYAKA